MVNEEMIEQWFNANIEKLKEDFIDSKKDEFEEWAFEQAAEANNGE